MLITAARRITDKATTLGATHTAQLIAENVAARVMGEATRTSLRRHMSECVHAGFDLVRGVDTAMPAGSPSEPTDATTFGRILRILDVDPATHAWVDVGCGRGRTVLLAAQAGFRQIIGVELDPTQAAIARRNLTRGAGLERKADIEIVNSDICEYSLPASDQVLFCFNPFGRATMERLIARVIQPSPYRRILVYYNAVHRDVTERSCARGDLHVLADFELLYGDCLILEVTGSPACSLDGPSSGAA